MSFPQYGQVERAFNELRGDGLIRHRDNQEEVEQDKGLLTRRAAYYANQADGSLGILEKTTGNNSRGYSVDIIIARDGRFWDVVTDRDGDVFPVNGGENNDPNLIGRWRQPTRELAALGDEPQPEPGPTPGPGPAPQPIPNVPGLEQIAAECKRQADEIAALRVELVASIDKASAELAKAVKSFRLWATPTPRKKAR